MSFNPVKRVFDKVEILQNEAPMTVGGTLTKLTMLLGTLGLGAVAAWFLFFSHNTLALPILGISFFTALILSIISVFRPQLTRYTALPYALCEGIVLGAISAIFETRYPGIAAISVALTSSTAIGMLLLYRLQIIKVTETFKAVIVSATAGIALTYTLILIMSLFGFNAGQFYASTSLTSIIFSLFVVAIAAFNLLLDFALIEESVERELPQYMEWYAAFNLLVTLVWLYLEILRLVAKLARKED